MPKATNGSSNRMRERLLINLLNNSPLAIEDYAIFPCSVGQINAIPAMFPAGGTAVLAGGMNCHHDFVLRGADGQRRRVELKSATKKSAHGSLSWRPWKDSCQFMNVQVGSAPFLNGFGLTMWEAWFQRFLVPFITNHLPEFVGMSIPAYVSLVSNASSSIPPSATESLEGRFLKKMVEDAPLRKLLKAEWGKFEAEWFPAHPPEIEGLRDYVRKVIEEKDDWLVINVLGASRIDGFNVLDLRYDGCHPKVRSAGCRFTYTLTLQKKSGGETKDIPVEMFVRFRNMDGMANLSADMR